MPTKTYLHLVLFASCLFAVTQLADAFEGTLWPGGAFDIVHSMPQSVGTSSLEVHNAVLRGNSLYFVVSNGPSATDAFLLATDLYGGYKSGFSLGPGTVRDFQVDETGHIIVLFGTPTDHLAMFSQQGEHVSDVPAPNALFLAFVQGFGVLEIFDDGHFRSLRSPVTSGVVPLVKKARATDPARFLFVGLPEGHLAVIEGVKAEMQIIDIGSGTVNNITLAAPEIDVVRSYNNTMHRGQDMQDIAVVTAAASPSGALYILVAHYKSQDGPFILRMNSSGQKLERFRSQLPAQKNKIMLPEAMFIIGKQLLIVGSAGLVSAYNLEL